MKLKKGVKRFLIAVVIILVAVLAFFLFKNLDSNQETKEVKVVSKISEYGYTLKDSKTKAYKDMFKDLKAVVEDLNIFRLNNCMDALMYFRSLKNNSDNDYDLLITDNYMPLRKDSFDLVQSVIYIINSFKNDVSESVPICVCSSDKFNVKCDYEFVKYLII